MTSVTSAVAVGIGMFVTGAIIASAVYGLSVVLFTQRVCP
jgi:hypothetical protein